MYGLLVALSILIAQKTLHLRNLLNLC